MANNSGNTKAFYNTEIPEEWENIELGKRVDILTGYAFPSNKFSESGIKLLRGSNVKRNQLDWKEDITRYWPADALLRKFELKDHDLVIALDGALIGRSFAKITEDDLPAYLVQRVARLRGKGVDQSFLHTLFTQRSFELHVDSVKTHTAIPHISPTDIRKFRVNLPPLPEQKAIAQVLSTADTAIHTTDKLIAQKELRKKWLMQQLLTGKKRLKGFDGEWTEKKLSDLFDRVTRKNIEGNTTVVTISAQRGFVRQTDFFNRNIASEITDNYFLVERGEFCYNKSYSNGYPWGAIKRLNDFDKAVVTTLYICFGIKNQKEANPEFFEQYFGANRLDKGLTKIAHEGGRAHGLLNVTPTDFFSLEVIVPSFGEQTAIAQVLQAADKEINLFKARAEKLRAQKKGLMQQLLTGKKRLSIII